MKRIIKKITYYYFKFKFKFLTKKVKTPLKEFYYLSGDKFFLNSYFNENYVRKNYINDLNLVNLYYLNENFINKLRGENNLKVKQIQDAGISDKEVEFFNKIKAKSYERYYDMEILNENNPKNLNFFGVR